jgi:transcriptional regulator with XRE-family HTH domain
VPTKHSGEIKIVLLTREEFYKRIGQVLRREREERGLSRAELAQRLNQIPSDPERHLRRVAALSVIAGHIRRQKGLSRKQVAERANLPVEFVRDMEAGKIWDPETYSIYCLAYGLRTTYPTFEKRVDALSRTELDENDRPVRRKKKHTSLPQPHPPLLLEPGSTEDEKP